MRKLISGRAAGLRSPIRDILGPARRLAATGKKIYFFNIGDPNKFDFDTPAHIRAALARVAGEKVGHYSDSEGDAGLLKRISEVESAKTGARIPPEHVCVTTGLSEAILFLMGALLEPGDEMLLPRPVYPPYLDYAQFFGGRAVTYSCSEDLDWVPDIEDLRRKISERTKAIVLINPNNPTGAVYPASVVKGVLDVAAESGIPVVADEIYDKLIFRDGTGFSPAISLAKDVAVIGFNGFSKNFLAPGWRMGYACFHNPANDPAFAEVEEGFRKQARLRLSACTPIQRALIHAWDDTGHFAEIQGKLRERADFAHKTLNAIPGLSVRNPAGAFYIFPKVDLSLGGWESDKEFALDVLESTGLVLVAGDGFACPGHFRSVILPPLPLMAEAFGKLDAFMRSKSRK